EPLGHAGKLLTGLNGVLDWSPESGAAAARLDVARGDLATRLGTGQAEASYRRAADRLARQAADAQAPDLLAARADCLGRLGLELARRGRACDAAKVGEERRGVLARLAGKAPRVPDFHRELALALAPADPARAERAARAAVELAPDDG